MANSMDPDQTAPIGAVCFGSTLFASILNSSVMLGNYLQQTALADNIFRYTFFLGALRVNSFTVIHNSCHPLSLWQFIYILVKNIDPDWTAPSVCFH